MNPDDEITTLRAQIASLSAEKYEASRRATAMHRRAQLLEGIEARMSTLRESHTREVEAVRRHWHRQVQRLLEQIETLREEALENKKTDQYQARDVVTDFIAGFSQEAHNDHNAHNDDGSKVWISNIVDREPTVQGALLRDSDRNVVIDECIGVATRVEQEVPPEDGEESAMKIMAYRGARGAAQEIATRLRAKRREAP